MADDINALLERASGSGSLPAPVVLNPLAAMSSAAQTANTIYGLREKQAQEAAGQAYQGAINQDTGEFDPNRFRTLLSQSGPAAMAAGAALLNTQQITSNQLDQNLKKAQWVNSAAGAALQSGDYSDAAMLKLFQTGIANGVITMPEVQRQIQLLPQDAAGRQRWLTEHQMQSASVQEQLQQRQGKMGTVTGPTGALTGYVQSPQTGAITTPPQQGAPQGLGPEGQAQYQQWLQGEVEIPDPSNPGGTQKGTRLQMFQRMGVDPKLFYPGGTGESSAVPPAAPATSASPNRPTPTAPAAPASGSPLSKPSQADIDTQKAGAGMGVALTQRAGMVPENRSNLGNMLTDAAKLDSMGAGSAREAYLNSFFQKWSGSGLLGNSTREQIAAAESFNKIANIMAGNQMAALGASDARQQLAIGANPHLDLSKLGNEQIIHMLQGNEDAIAAKSQAWEDWKLSHGSGSYAQFQNDLNKNFDLRVFQQRYMSQPEVDAMKAQMKQQGTDKEFIRKVLYARSQGWIQ